MRVADRPVFVENVIADKKGALMKDKIFCPKYLHHKCVYGKSCPKVPSTQDFNSPEGPLGFHYQLSYKCFKSKEKKDARKDGYEINKASVESE